VDSDAANSKRVGFIGSDNVAAGKTGGGLAQSRAAPGRQNHFNASAIRTRKNAKDRIQAIQDGLAGSNIEIIDTLADGTKTDVAQKNAQEALAKHPDLAGLVGLYSYNGPAILTAVRGAGQGWEGEDRFALDDDSATLDGIAAGDIYGTVLQVSTRIGYETVRRMDKISWRRQDAVVRREGPFQDYCRQTKVWWSLSKSIGRTCSNHEPNFHRTRLTGRGSPAPIPEHTFSFFCFGPDLARVPVKWNAMGT